MSYIVTLCREVFCGELMNTVTIKYAETAVKNEDGYINRDGLFVPFTSPEEAHKFVWEFQDKAMAEFFFKMLRDYNLDSESEDIMAYKKRKCI